MEEASDGLHEKQKHGRRYGRGEAFLAFGSGWTALGCVGRNNNKINILLFKAKGEQTCL